MGCWAVMAHMGFRTSVQAVKCSCQSIARRIEPSDANFNLANPDKYNGSYGGLPRLAGYIARARTEAAAAQQDILVLHAGGLGWQRGVADRLKGRVWQKDGLFTLPTAPVVQARPTAD